MLVSSNKSQSEVTLLELGPTVGEIIWGPVSSAIDLDKVDMTTLVHRLAHYFWSTRQRQMCV